MTRLEFFQYLLILAVLLWPLWLALFGLSLEVLKAVRRRSGKGPPSDGIRSEAVRPPHDREPFFNHSLGG